MLCSWDSLFLLLSWTLFWPFPHGDFQFMGNLIDFFHNFYILFLFSFSLKHISDRFEPLGDWFFKVKIGHIFTVKCFLLLPPFFLAFYLFAMVVPLSSLWFPLSVCVYSFALFLFPASSSSECKGSVSTFLPTKICNFLSSAEEGTISLSALHIL